MNSALPRVPKTGVGGARPVPPAAGRPGACAPARRRSTCRGLAGWGACALGLFRRGKSRGGGAGRGGAGPRAQVLAGPRGGAEARRLCCFGYRTAAAAATTTTGRIVAVTAAGTGAALWEPQRGRQLLALLKRGRPGQKPSSCATGGIVCPGVREPVPEERRG
ncbi:hypothetical protein ABFV05_015226 [Capra hircus]